MKYIITLFSLLFTINLSHSQSAPVASNVSAATVKNTNASIHLVASDADFDSLTYSIVSNPSNGTISLSDDIVTYTPTTDYTGTDTFTFKANDGSLDSAIKTVTVKVIGGYKTTQTQIGTDIDGEAADDYSGASVSFNEDGTKVAIGAYGNDGNGINSGHVRVYSWNGSAWTKLGDDIDGEAAGDFSGNSVSLSSDGTTVAIGAYQNNGNGGNSGHVRVYSWSGSVWTKQGDDINGEASNDQSGYSVSLSSDGTTVAIGANKNDGNGNNAGHVRVYSWNGSAWTKLGNDIDGEALNDESGSRVSLSSDGTTVAIGAYYNDANGSDSGHVRVYSWNGSAWTKLGDDIDGEATNDYSGYSVSLSSDGTTVAIGTIYDDANGNNSGQVRVYSWSGSTWTKLGDDINGESGGDYVGYSVSLSSDGTILAIAAYSEEGNGLNVGHVKVYSWNGSTWTKLGDDIDGESAGDFFGRSVSLSSDGTTVAIGSTQHGGSSGHVRVYNLVNANAPVAVTDTMTVVEDASLTSKDVIANDTDVEGDTLSLTSVTTAGTGTVAINADGVSVDYTPAANFNGTEVITYTVSDGTLTNATGTLTVTVTAVNDAPVAVANTLTVLEDAALTSTDVIANDTDIDGDTLSLTSVTTAGTGTVAINTDGVSVDYTPAANFNGTEVITYTVSDGTLTDATGTLTVTVTAVNDAPVAVTDTMTVVEDASLTSKDVIANDTDVEGDTLSLTSVTTAGTGTVAINADGVSVDYTPAANFNGTEVITYTVSDGTLTNATGTLTVTVTAVNDAPVAVANTLTVLENASLTSKDVIANDTDVDGDTLSLTAVTTAGTGTVAINSDGVSVDYTPAANFNGTEVITYTVSDGTLTDATGTLTVTVTAVNDAPVAVTDTMTVVEDASLTSKDVIANDTDVEGDTLSLTSVTTAGTGTVAINADGVSVDYTPAANFNGTEVITYTVSDGTLTNATGTLTVTVTAVNDAPVAVTDTMTVLEDTSLTSKDVIANDTDTDGDTLSLTAVTTAGTGTVAINSDGVSVDYTPAANFNGTEVITYTVSDGTLTDATGTLTITVNTNNYTINVTASSSANYTLSGTDFNGAVSGNDPNLTFYVGDQITFAVNASNHPFYIKTVAGTGTGNQASNVTNNGTESGNVVWTPTEAGTYYYQCSAHSGMVGTITIASNSNLSGSVNNDTTWALSGSPYTITGNILIASGVTLTIEAGVTVKVNSGLYIKNEGVIKAVGTSSDKITFQSSSDSPAIPSDWEGIRIRSTGGSSIDGSQNYSSGSQFKYVVIKNADIGLYIYDAGLHVSYTEFDTNNFGVEIRKTDGVVIDNSIFSENTIGIWSAYEAFSFPDDITGHITNTYIKNSTFSNNNNGVDLWINQRDFKNLNIIKNIFNGNNIGIDFGGGGYGPRVHSVLISENIVYNSTSYGVNLGQVYGLGTDTSADYPLELTKNIIVNNAGGALFVGSSSSVKYKIDKNILTNNESDINSVLFNHRSPAHIISNNSIISKGKNIYIDGSSSYHPNNLNFTYNLFSNASNNEIIDIKYGSGHVFNNNNLSNPSSTGYFLKNQTANSIDAENNYWGTSTESEIQAAIYDYSDDFELGAVDYTPFSTAPNPTPPISSPSNVTKSVSGSDVVLNWSANGESDVAGYKLYYGTPTGYSYVTVVDLGNVTTYTVTDGDIATEYAITAYDSDKDDDDDMVDGNESWFSVSNQVNVTLSSSATSISEPTNSATLTATLDNISSADVVVNLTYTGTATNATDFSGAASITISAGSLTGTTAITAIDDTDVELTETIIIDMGDVSGGAENGTQQVTINLTDNDLPSVSSITVDKTSIDENGGVAVITATISAAQSKDVTIPLTITGTSTIDTDYSTADYSDKISIPSGSISGTITFTGVQDSNKEDDETIIITPSTSPTNATSSISDAIIITILDENFAPVATAQTNVAATEQTELTITLAGTDSNDDTLTYIVSTLPTNGTLSDNGTVITADDLPKTTTNADVVYVSTSDTATSDSFTFKVNDGTLDSEAATVSLAITAVNDEPTKVNLSTLTVDENAAETEIGTLSTDDLDTNDTFTYELVSGEGDTDNSLFTIDSDKLKNTDAFDFETKSSYSVRIKSTDSGSASIEGVFAITVKNINDITISSEITSTYCDGSDGTGSITIVTSEINGEVTYTWTGPNGFTSTDQNLSGLESGTYELTVKDDSFEKSIELVVEKTEIFNNLSICYVTSDSEDFTKNRIFLSYQDIYNDKKYEILREGSSAGIYEKIGELDSGETSFLDTSSNSSSSSYSYRVRLLDNCDVVSSESSIHKTILLQSSLATDNSVNLSWTSYEGVSYSTYKIYRRVNNGSFEELTAISSTNNSYNDTAADVTQNAYSYYVSISINTCLTTKVSVNENGDVIRISATEGTSEIKSNQKFIQDDNGDYDKDGVLNSVDKCPNTPEGSIVDLDGCTVFTLPLNNNKVEVTSASCIGNADGSIGLSVEDNSFDYSITVTGKDDPIAITGENKTASVTGLSKGDYTVCFKVTGQADYEQCFDVTIGEPKALSAFIDVDNDNRSTTIQLGGSKDYNVDINGERFKVTGDNFTSSLKTGLNSIRISTGLDCQGMIEREVFISEDIHYYPNPTQDDVRVHIGGEDSKVMVSVFSEKGSLIYQREQQVQDVSRLTEIDLALQITGTYIVTLEGPTVRKTFKIVKR